MKYKLPHKSSKSLIKEADKLFKDFIYQRDKWTCQRCKKMSPLNLAHFYSRAVKQVRFDPLNACVLCVDCHMNFAHKEPYEFGQWWKNRIGEENLNLLQMRKNTYRKMDYEFEKLILQKRLESQPS